MSDVRLREFGFAEFAAAAKMTESELLHMLRVGVLRATARATTGRGHHRRFSFLDLVVAIAMTKVKDLRIDGTGQRLIADQLYGMLTKVDDVGVDMAGEMVDGPYYDIEIGNHGEDRKQSWAGLVELLPESGPAAEVINLSPVRILVKVRQLLSMAEQRVKEL